MKMRTHVMTHRAEDYFSFYSNTFFIHFMTQMNLITFSTSVFCQFKKKKKKGGEKKKKNKLNTEYIFLMMPTLSCKRT